MSLASKQTHLETYPDGVRIRSRYLRVQQTLDFYPLKRSKLYEYLASGAVKSFLLKEKGAVRGIRLIDKDSLDTFLESHALRAERKSVSDLTKCGGESFEPGSREHIEKSTKA